jgi:hypothetical protein
MADKISIGSRLPGGLILENPLDKTDTVTLNGLNKAAIIGATYVTTEISKDFWDMWVSVNNKFSAYENGSIFVIKNAKDAENIYREFESSKTGFERTEPNSHGIKTMEN